MITNGSVLRSYPLIIEFFLRYIICLLLLVLLICFCLSVAPEYEIIYPKYVTDDVTRGICSDAIVGDSLNINIDAFGNNLKLVVHQDSSLFSEDFYAEKIQENGQPVPLSVRTDCFYTGEVESEPDSMISLSTCSGLVSKTYE